MRYARPSQIDEALALLAEPGARVQGGGTDLAGQVDRGLAEPETIVDLSDVDFSVTGLYEHFRAEGIHLRVAHQTISSRRAEAREARLLGGRKGDPVLTMERTSFDDGGRAVEYGTHLYRPDLYSYETTLVDR